MKKIFLIVWTIMLCTLTGYAQQANIYASGLKAEAAANDQVEISYLLNADATALAVSFVNGDQTVATVPVTDAALLTKGAHTATISLANIPDGIYTWSVTATGNPNTAVAKISDETATIAFTTPRGLAIDKHVNSPFFGRIYVSDSKNTATTGGIYVFDAILADVTNQGSTAWSQIFSGSAASPFRLSIAPDSRVVISDWSDNATSGAHIWNPATPETNAVSIFGGTVGAGGVASESGVNIHGSVSYALITGTDADAKLYTYDEDMPAILNIYNIGSSETPWTAAPSVAMTNPAGLANKCGTIISDKKGGWWLGQHRWEDSSGNPGIMHLNADGAIDFTSKGELTADAKYNTRGAIALNADQTLAATVSDNSIKVFEIAYDQAAVPSIPATPAYTLETTFVSSCYSLDFDPAGNIYATGDGKVLNVWALPKTENTFTTPAPTSQAIQVGGADIKMLDSDNSIRLINNNDAVRLSTSGTKIKAYTLYSVSGSKLSGRTVSASEVVIPTGNLSTGVYLLRVVTDEGTAVKRFIKN
jgi:hypothetical protein